MRILHTVEFYHPHTGGSQLVVRELSERLARRGHEVTVATSADHSRTFSEWNGVRVLSFDVRGNEARGIHGRDVNRYRELLYEPRFDIALHYAAQQWATDLALRELPRTRNLRANILAPCGFSALSPSGTVRWPEYRRYYRKILPERLPLFESIVYHSKFFQDYEYGVRCGLTNGVVIPNGVALEEFDAAPAIDFRAHYGIRTRLMGLCVANYVAGKGQERVIEAVRRMRRSDFTMVFIGREGERHKDFEARAGGLPVLLLRDIPRAHTVAAYRAADVFVFGSLFEVSPLVILEAKAAGIPFVSTPCGNVAEWSGGIICEAERLDVELGRLLDDEELRRRLGSEGRRQVELGLSWERIVDRYEELYEKAIRLKRVQSQKAEPHHVSLVPSGRLKTVVERMVARIRGMFMK